MSNSRLGRQVEAYRMARRIVRACNRMKAGQGVALQWCTQQRHVLHDMAQRVAMGLRKRKTPHTVVFRWPDGSTTKVPLSRSAGEALRNQILYGRHARTGVSCRAIGRDQQ